MRTLASDYPKMRAKDKGLHRVLFDFDGTLAEDTWPSLTIGKPIPEGVEALVHYAQGGYEVSVYTARPASHASLIRKWLVAEGLSDIVYDIICDKPAAWLYVDDRAWNPWKEQDGEPARTTTGRGSVDDPAEAPVLPDYEWYGFGC